MQAAFDEFAGVHPHDDVETDMHDLFFLLGATPDSEGASEPDGGALRFSAAQPHLTHSPGSSTEAFCIADLLPIPCGLPTLKVKQEPLEAHGHAADVCESSLACTSSSGGASPLSHTPAPAASPVHAMNSSLFNAGVTSTLHAPYQAPPYTHLPSANSTPLHTAVSLSDMPGGGAAAAADDAAAPTQSDSTDAAPYDFLLTSKAATSRAAGRGSAAAKKPPLSHSTIEKHRRDRINHLIEELGEMVPAVDPRYKGDGADASGLKRPKHAVLADVVIRYRQLQAENDSLRRQLAAAGLQPGSPCGSGPASNPVPAEEPGSGASATQRRAPQLASPPPPASSPPATAAPPAPPGTAAAATAAAAAVTQRNSAASPTAASAPPHCSAVATTAGAAPSTAAAAAAVSSLLSAAGASAAHLQAALHFPLIKAAAAAAAAAAATAPMPGFVPVATPAPSIAVAAPAAPGPNSSNLYNPCTAAAAASGNQQGLQVPDFGIVPPPPPPPLLPQLPHLSGGPDARKSTPDPAATAATAAAAAVAAAAAAVGPVLASAPSAGSAECMTAPTSCPATDMLTSTAAVMYGGNASVPTARASDRDAAPAAADGTDSSSTEVHVCRSSTAAKPKPGAAAAAAATPPGTPLRQPGAKAANRRPGATTAVPPSPPAAAPAAPSAPADAAASWLVRVVCPPRKDLLAASCSALAEAGVALRSARVTAASGGRVALELEVSCEEGVLPRGMQAGHIHCAIHEALQASAAAATACGQDAAEGEGREALGALLQQQQQQEMGEQAGQPVAAPLHGRAAVGAATTTSRAAGRKRQRV